MVITETLGARRPIWVRNRSIDTVARSLDAAIRLKDWDLEFHDHPAIWRD
ncbi:hypothetical protein [Bradyrhizobium genosp. A]